MGIFTNWLRRKVEREILFHKGEILCLWGREVATVHKDVYVDDDYYILFSNVKLNEYGSLSPFATYNLILLERQGAIVNFSKTNIKFIKNFKI